MARKILQCQHRGGGSEIIVTGLAGDVLSQWDIMSPRMNRTPDIGISKLRNAAGAVTRVIVHNLCQLMHCSGGKNNTGVNFSESLHVMFTKCRDKTVV